MSLFQLGNFQLSSGKQSKFKIECDSLTEADYKALAFLVNKSFWFKKVIGASGNGQKFSKALEPYADLKGEQKRLVTLRDILFVDDVYTTGNTMNKLAENYLGFPLSNAYQENFQGIVIFSRAIYKPYWIASLCDLHWCNDY